ncbi:hypothetical protein AVT30_gp35 [Mycobacterium phage UnionJack]|uniref:Uncharacterized protein n=1 Tax=Mycobacterium phage UnionJack TaxID=1673876 RepID=A0A0K1LIZ2_9CAUD|nr:hypothetical protein AVT30_gp35 [Mycobacterium phage UnionJack]AKU42409.1 hypothetical protein UNIONJACK_57 [Mycobacterium phage UnionJack]
MRRNTPRKMKGRQEVTIRHYKVEMEISTSGSLTEEELSTLRQKLVSVPLDDAFDRAVALADYISVEESV